MASIRSRLFYRFYKWQTSPLDPKYSVEQQRANLERFAKRAPMPRGVAVAPVVVGDRPGEWLSPTGAADDRAVLYLHGGGYCMGSCVTHRALAARIAAASRARILLLEYRLAPEHPFPAGLDDALASADWLAERGFAAGKLALAGDSAGGGLVIACALALRDSGKPRPAALACLSPWTDLTGSGESIATGARLDPLLTPESGVRYVAAYCGDTDPRSPLISPLFADLSRLPPMLLQVGDREILLSDSVRLADAARAAGVEVSLEVWPGMWHVWQAAGGFVPEAQRAVDRIGGFLAARMG